MDQIKEIPWADKALFSNTTYAFSSNPPEFLLSLAEHSDGAVRFKIGPFSVALVTDPACVREILVTKAKQFPKAPRDVNVLSRFIGKGLVTTNGETHMRQRKMSQPAFHSSRIQSYAETMVAYAEAVMAGWQDGESLDIDEEMMALTMYVVGKTLFNTDMEALKGGCCSNRRGD